MSKTKRIEYLEATVIDRERRIFNLASIIRGLTKNGATIPLTAEVDYTITLEEATALGISNYNAAVQVQRIG